MSEFLTGDKFSNPPINGIGINEWGHQDSWALVWFTDGTGLFYLASNAGLYSDVTPEEDFYTELWEVQRDPETKP